MVTKKQRRRRLAQASAERRAARLSVRAARRRRLRIAAATLAVLVAVTGLVLWIVTHEDDRETTAATAVHPTVRAVPTPIEVTR